MFVVYHIASTMQVGPLPNSYRPHSLYAKTYKTYAAAARACGRFNGFEPGQYACTTEDNYRTHVVKMVTRVNMMSGKEYQELSNTPGYCSPSSEAYWSM